MKKSNYLGLNLPEGTDKVDYQTFFTDNYNKIDSSLAEKAKQTDVNTALNLKRDKTTTIKLVDLDTEVKTAMTGGSVAVVGVNSTGTENIKDKAITPDKTDFFNVNRTNLFNPNTVVDGYVGSNGNIVTDTSMKCSDFIPVKPSTKYSATSNGSRYCGYYDANKALISQFFDMNNINTPANCAYVRYTVANAQLTTAMFVEGATLPAQYVSYNDYTLTLVQTFNNAVVNVINTQKSISLVKPTDTNFITQISKNLFDKTKVIDGIVSSSNGGVIANTSYCVSDYIPVIYGKGYKTNSTFDMAFYDVNKVYVSGLSGHGGTITIPANAAFARFTIVKSSLNTAMVVQGELPSEYVAFTDTSTGDILIKDTKFEDMLNRNFNTYIKANPITPQQTTFGMDSATAQSKWAGKVWDAIGDSITEVNGTATKRYHDYIKEKIACTVNNYGVSGTGWFVDGSQTALAFYKRLNNFNVNADLITVFGGTNDWGEVGGKTLVLGNFGDTDPAVSLYGAVDYTIQQLVTKFPTKTIAVFTPIPRNNNWAGSAVGGVTLEQVADAIIKVCKKYSIPVLDLYRESNFYAWNSTFRTANLPDGLHPNDNGHKILADKILSFLNKL